MIGNAVTADAFLVAGIGAVAMLEVLFFLAFHRVNSVILKPLDYTRLDSVAYRYDKLDCSIPGLPFRGLLYILVFLRYR